MLYNAESPWYIAHRQFSDDDMLRWSLDTQEFFKDGCVYLVTFDDEEKRIMAKVTYPGN